MSAPKAVLEKAFWPHVVKPVSLTFLYIIIELLTRLHDK